MESAGSGATGIQTEGDGAGVRKFRSRSELEASW